MSLLRELLLMESKKPKTRNFVAKNMLKTTKSAAGPHADKKRKPSRQKQKRMWKKEENL